MDARLFRSVNRLATRTGWAHWFFIGVAKYGIVLLAVALLAGWWLGRRAEPGAVVAVMWEIGRAHV